MGNLGMYQWMTSTAKKVGGPLPFLLMFILGGAGLYKSAEIVIQKSEEAVKRHQNQKGLSVQRTEQIYTIATAGTSNDGVNFKVGEQIKVLERDGNCVMIEKIGDKNNPYFVSAEFIRTISNFN